LPFFAVYAVEGKGRLMFEIQFVFKNFSTETTNGFMLFDCNVLATLFYCLI